MYKMLIAEREQEQVEVISNYTKSVLKDVEVVEVEKNGVKVLKYLEENELDILVLSLQLEGISGLEVVRQVRKTNSNIHIVIISAYDYSDFVIEAMNYGVKDYLMKPVKLTEYSQVISNIIDEIDMVRLNRSKKNELERREDQKTIFADYSFIYAFLWNDQITHFVKLYREILGIGRFGYVVNIELVHAREECVLELEKDFRMIYHGIKDLIAPTNTCVVGPMLGKRIIVYVSLTDKQAEAEDRVTASIKLANILRYELERFFSIEVRVGIGAIRKLEEIHTSYEEAIKSLRYMEENNVMHIKDISKNMISHKSYIEMEAKFLQSAKFGKQECMEQFAQILEVLQPLNIQEIRNKLLELLIILCHEVRTQCENEVNNLDYISFVSQINNLDLEQLKTWAYTKVEYIIKSVRTSRNERKSVVVKEALEYINENFKENLTLEIISSYVGVTPQHFSKIFKEETKSTYVEWLTNVRMDKAKEYLMEGTRTIKEICYAVGFHDPNYFSRIFKKTVGKSPTEFLDPGMGMPR